MFFGIIPTKEEVYHQDWEEDWYDAGWGVIADMVVLAKEAAEEVDADAILQLVEEL